MATLDEWNNDGFVDNRNSFIRGPLSNSGFDRGDERKGFGRNDGGPGSRCGGGAGGGFRQQGRGGDRNDGSRGFGFGRENGGGAPLFDNNDFKFGRGGGRNGGFRDNRGGEYGDQGALAFDEPEASGRFGGGGRFQRGGRSRGGRGRFDQHCDRDRFSPSGSGRDEFQADGFRGGSFNDDSRRREEGSNFCGAGGDRFSGGDRDRFHDRRGSGGFHQLSGSHSRFEDNWGNGADNVGWRGGTNDCEGQFGGSGNDRQFFGRPDFGGGRPKRGFDSGGGGKNGGLSNDFGGDRGERNDRGGDFNRGFGNDKGDGNDRCRGFKNGFGGDRGDRSGRGGVFSDGFGGNEDNRSDRGTSFNKGFGSDRCDRNDLCRGIKNGFDSDRCDKNGDDGNFIDGFGGDKGGRNDRDGRFNDGFGGNRSDKIDRGGGFNKGFRGGRGDRNDHGRGFNNGFGCDRGDRNDRGGVFNDGFDDDRGGNFRQRRSNDNRFGGFDDNGGRGSFRRGGFGGQGFRGSRSDDFRPPYQDRNADDFRQRNHPSGDGGADFDQGEERLSGGGRVAPVTYVPEETNTEELLKDHISVGDYIQRTYGQKVQESGENIPPPIAEFSELGLPEVLSENLQKLDMQHPLPIQAHGISVVLARRDLMACAQTGSGKTAAFLIPAIMMMLKEGGYEGSKQPAVIIVEPTRELAIQVGNETKKLALNTSIRGVVIYGGVSVRYHLSEMVKGCNILVATPGRLRDFIERGIVSLRRCSMVVLDEADRMLSMGFEREMRKIVDEVQRQTQAREVQTLMFSATFPHDIREMAQSYLKSDYIFKTVGMIGAANCDIHQEVLNVKKSGKNVKLEEILADEFGTNEEGDKSKSRSAHKVLVFVETKRESDLVATMLSIKDLPSTSMNGDRLQQEREKALRDFKSGKFPILVTTSVCARGLDIAGVDHVINFDLPIIIDDYVHRIGRTGRVGNPGRATSFYDSDVDRALAPALVNQLQISGQAVPDWLLQEAGCATSNSTFAVQGDFHAPDLSASVSHDREGSGEGGNGDGNVPVEGVQNLHLQEVPAAVAASFDDDLGNDFGNEF